MQMKIKFLLFIAGILLMAGVMTSCLNNDDAEISYSPESSIYSFSLGTAWRNVVGVDSNGNDSAYVDSLDISGYPFTINQLTRVIENKDSLPVGTQIDKLLVNISSDTGYIVYKKSGSGSTGEDMILATTDSLDFSAGPIEMKVLSYAGTFGNPYTVKVNVHQQEPDSLQWSLPFEQPFVAGALSRQKAVLAGDKLIVFGQTAGGDVTAEYATLNYRLVNGVATHADPSAWQSVALPAGTDSYSPICWQGAVYFLAAHELYRLDPADMTYALVAAGTGVPQLGQLLVGTELASSVCLYARQEDGHFVTYDASAGTWNDEGDVADFPYVAGSRLASVALPVSHNSSLARLVSLAENPVSQDSAAIVGTRLTNDATWRGLVATASALSCPNMADPTLLYYDGKLIAYGGKAVNNNYTHDAFVKLYVSEDNGLTWNVADAGLSFPKDNAAFVHYYNKEMAGGYSSVADDYHFIWIVWTDGTLSRGRINRLGFQPKWN